MKLKFIIILFFILSALSAQQIGDGFAPATITNFSAPIKSGIYNGLNTTTIGMVPDNSQVWQHLIVARHIGTTNNYQLQIASTFAVNDRLFFRKIAASDLSAQNTNWVELATRGINNFEGNQTINGSVGIGTSTPLAKLEINNGNLLVRNLINSDNESATMIAQTIYNNGIYGTSIKSITQSGGNNTYGMQFFTQESYVTKQTEKMRILGNGNVGIGVLNPLNKLDVNGTIHSKEVKVDMDKWSDFVFKKEYILPTLQQVEEHIKEKGYLENIPNEKEVLENGISLGEMNSKLLQKIEELTLYVIQQNKQITNLQSRLDKIELNSN
ncbi:hypothetical protein ASE21_07535 [Flavobacterium sp. Root901]|uniref:hypothetical protein n=1 Tax=Flavobacterium sp. Root901 TaxID=1736605 RepID=UPI00070AF8A9|nr:hypothetical protein [Flavobacterium sp. Root901]KRD11551.1 hypothetical protein ASE21_07535 [Flavobacterium sp. Root901]